MLIAQLSDLHITRPGTLCNGVVDTAAHLARAVAHLAALAPRPDLAVITGDLVEEGAPAEYERLRALLAPLPMPLYVLPGNHDERGALREAFGDGGYLPAEGPFLHYTVEGHPVRLIALDTLVPGEAGGTLCETRLAWLEARLAEAPQRPTVVCMHHPPFAVGLPIDRQRCANGEALAALIARHPQVERVICGHVHRPVQLRWAGTAAAICPSPAHQVVLDLEGSGRSRFALEPPGFQLHLWREDTGLITHTAPVGAFEGPYRFRSGG